MFGTGVTPPFLPRGNDETFRRRVTFHEQVLEDIRKNSHSDFATLFQGFFKHFPEESLTSWYLEDTGLFRLSLQIPLMLWVLSKDGEGKVFPSGGTIFIFDKEIKGTVKKKDKEIEFTTGFKMYCETPLGKRDVHIVKMSRLDSGTIETEAGIYLPLLGFRSGRKQKNAEQFIDEWYSGTALSAGADYQSYLIQKINSL